MLACQMQLMPRLARTDPNCMEKLLAFFKESRGHPSSDVCATIWQLYSQMPVLFHQLFVLGQTVTEIEFGRYQQIREALSNKGFLSGVGETISASVMIVPLRQKLIVTDWPTSTDLRAIFPIYRETLHLIDQIPQKLENALDIGAGSGVVSVFLADASRTVLAADINPRALLFTSFNAELNGVREKVVCRKTDLLRECKGGRFEYVFVNLPFEPVPPGHPYFLHSDGGTDGLRVVKKFLRQVSHGAIDFETMWMVSFSLGNEHRVLIEEVIRHELGESHFGVDLQILARPMSFTEFAKRFRDASNFDSWQEETLRTGFDLLYFVALKIVPRSGFSLAVTQAHVYAKGWDQPIGPTGVQ